MASNRFVASIGPHLGRLQLQHGGARRPPERGGFRGRSRRRGAAPSVGSSSAGSCFHAPLVTPRGPEPRIRRRQSLDRSRQSAVDPRRRADQAWGDVDRRRRGRAGDRARWRARACWRRCGRSGSAWTASAPRAGLSEASLAERTDPLPIEEVVADLARGAQAVRPRHAGPARRRGDAAGDTARVRGRRQPEPARGAWPDRPLHRPGHAATYVG